MIKYMMLCLVAGFTAGRLDWLQWLNSCGSVIITICLCFMTFIASVDMGKKDFMGEVRRSGAKIILYSLATIVGTLIMAVVVSWALPLSAKDCLIAASGLGWYSLSTGLVFEYSPSLSIVTFVACYFREFTGMFLMPVLWKRFQTPELVSISGAAAMNPCISTATITGDQLLVFYGMISGSIISVFVPVLVPFMIAL